MKKLMGAIIVFCASINYAMDNNTHPVLAPQQVVIQPLLIAMAIGDNGNPQQENKVIYPSQKKQLPKQDERKYPSKKKYIIHQPGARR